ncbi:MAG: S-layer homology domain-containing protein [Oscillospiraceae bacterium]|nr:S-layer homology domain-containing protein [Oscillospiraceae bacterium]
MVLALVPPLAVNASADNLPDGLYFHDVYWDKTTGERVVDEAYQSNEIQMAVGSRLFAEFVYIENGEESQVNFDDLAVDNCVKEVIRSNGQEENTIAFNNPGKAAISYNNFTITITVVLPDFGFYTKPEASEENYISELRYNGTNGTVYFVPREKSWNITSADFRGSSVIVDESGKYATVTITDVSVNQITGRYTANYGNGNDFGRNTNGISIVDVTPGLKWRWTSWDEETQSYMPGSDSNVNNSINGQINNGRFGELVYFDGEKYENVTADKVTVDNPDIATVSAYTAQPEFTDLDFLNFGETNISYTADGKEYKLHVNVGLPTFGFYSEPEASEENYISELRYNGTNGTVYLVPLNDSYLITDAVIYSGNDAELEIVDGKYVKVTVDDITSSWLRVRVSYNSDYFSTVILNLVDVTPGLKWRWTSWDEETQSFIPGSDSNVNNSINGHMSSGWSGELVYFDGENYENVTADKVTVDNPDIVTVSAEAEQPEFTVLRFTDFGETDLIYNGNKLHVTVGLPVYGFYAKPEASEENYISKLTYNGTNGTVYLVPINDSYVITDVGFDSGSDADLEIVDGKYVKVTFEDITTPWCFIRIYSNFGYTTVKLNLADATPGLVSRSLKYNEETDSLEPNLEDEATKVTEISAPIGWNLHNDILWLDENGELTHISASEFTKSGDYFSLSETENGVTVIHFENFGHGGYISYNGNKIAIDTMLPFFGFYSAPQKTEANYISDSRQRSGYDSGENISFDYLPKDYLNSSDNKVYFYADDEIVDGSVKCDNENITATLAVDRDGAQYIEIAVDPALEASTSANVRYVIKNYRGEETREAHVDFRYTGRVFDWSPADYDEKTNTAKLRTDPTWYSYENTRYFSNGATMIWGIAYKGKLINDAALLKFSDNLDVEDLGGGFYKMVLNGWDFASIEYLGNDKGKTITIGNQLPYMGTYKSINGFDPKSPSHIGDEAALKESYIPGIPKLTELTDDTFYFLPIFRTVTAASTESKAAAVTLQNGIVTVKVNKSELTDYETVIPIDYTYTAGESEYASHMDVPVINDIAVQMTANVDTSSEINPDVYTGEQKELAQNVVNAIASVSASVDTEKAAEANEALAGQANEIAEDTGNELSNVDEVKVEVALSVKATEFDPESGKLTLDITPTVTYTYTENVEGSDDKTASNVVPNATETPAPITISITLPDSLTPKAIRHIHGEEANQVISYIPVTVVDNGNGTITVSWEQDKFSTVEILSDVAAINFMHANGEVEAVIFTEEDIGKSLVSDTKNGYTFKGWTIGDNTYTTLTQNLYDALKASKTALDATPVFTANPLPEDVVTPVVVPTSSAPYAITVETVENGKISVSDESAAKDDTVTVTVTPNEGYILDTITCDGAELTKVSDTEYTFTMPGKAVAIKATFKKALIFSDVEAGSYYEKAVEWAVENGITKGTSETTFMPNGDCTRAQAVTFLWRALNCPEPSAKASEFADVTDENAFYYKAVLWAAENDITLGIGDGTFGVDYTVTRGQMVTFMMRAMKGKTEKVESFADIAPESFYAEAAAWAKESGISDGIGNNKFGGEQNCLRAQIVTMLYRYFVK